MTKSELLSRLDCREMALRALVMLMRYLAVLGLLVPMYAQAANIMSGPVDPRTTHCGWVVDGGAKQDVPVALLNADKVCKLDIGAVTVGNHIITATAVIMDPAWGRLESATSVPFSVPRPAPPGVPTDLKLVP